MDAVIKPSSFLFINLLRLAWEHRGSVSPALKAASLYRWKRTRVSMSQIVRVRVVVDDSDRYLLIRSIAHPGQWKPLGGVLKYYSGGQEVLDSLGFVPQDSAHSHSARDLRGFLQGKKIPAFLVWFSSKHGRELECLPRELHEELVVACGITLNSDLSLSYLWTVQGGPQWIRPPGYAQYRRHEVYDLDVGDDLRESIVESTKGGGLYLATKLELEELRCEDGTTIGSHASYFFSTRPSAIEPSPRV